MVFVFFVGISYTYSRNVKSMLSSSICGKHNTAQGNQPSAKQQRNSCQSERDNVITQTQLARASMWSGSMQLAVLLKTNEETETCPPYIY